MRWRSSAAGEAGMSSERFVKLFGTLDDLLKSIQSGALSIALSPLKLTYFSYPYSDSPRERTAEIRAIVHGVVRVRHDIVPLVPHLMFDAIYNFPAGYTHEEMCLWEILLIAASHQLAYVPMEVSAGVTWERCIAKAFCKPIFTVNELIDNVDKESQEGKE